MDSSTSNGESQTRKNFAIIFILEAPGAGKGTLCTYLAKTYNLVHFSVGDNLRDWMCENRDQPLAERIQQKLQNQGFLTSEELNPFLLQAIRNALINQQSCHGILLDGFPRCMEQLESWNTWPFSADLVLKGGSKPDVVLSFKVDKKIARERYLARGRDGNDTKEVFQKRFAEYILETVPVEEAYRKRGMLIEIDTNSTKEETLALLSRQLEDNDLWQELMTSNTRGKSFFVV
ncbi:hypothetical protein TWF788_005949 [Orbilia oligospora]|uniref:Adenylate kinase n=1 Tax=Orbilia oligospora TaxID=2813651 RepID=A0A7C8PX11_ORBOL|nr:hypothetical protein TWF788_005949 [Orbilia oligospora]